MTATRYSYVFLGLSITSSWGNGHATTYRALLRQLAARGHGVLFLERDLPFYRANRDLADPPYGKTELYDSIEELRGRFSGAIRSADLVVVGSYVPEGVAVAALVTDLARGRAAFYDIDTPITLKHLAQGGGQYLVPDLVPKFDLYLSFTGGPTLARIAEVYKARRVRPLYCSVDPELYAPSPQEPTWDLGYLGTYSADRQPVLDRLLLETARAHPARRFAVFGAQYPDDVRWPANVARAEHLAPGEHSAFYNAQRFTLNVTRREMVVAGYSPSVRLFEAAACGTPIISDDWPGLDSFFAPGSEILLASSSDDVVRYLSTIGEAERVAIGARARARVLAEHSAAHRAEALEAYTAEVLAQGGGRPRSVTHLESGIV